MEGSYQHFEILKKNGSSRNIYAPKPSLKKIQTLLKELLEEVFKPHNAATAFVKNRGVVFNAKQHVGKAAVFNIDLENFFGTIHFGRVFGLLTSPPYSLQTETAKLIANLCCYNGVLPQGAPTSPIISNMICKSFDRDLSLLAKTNRAFYTRYADDITFSFSNISYQEIFTDEKEPSQTLKTTIEKHGFTINKSKTRLQYKTERQVVTGLKVNRKVNLDRRYIRTTRAMLHSLRLDPDSAREKFKATTPESEAFFDNVVHGRISYIGMIKGRHSSVFQNLALNFNSLGLERKFRLLAEPKNKINFDSVYRAHKGLLNNSIMIVDFEGYSESDTEIDDLIQGTAFSLADGRLVTAAHTFLKAKAKNGCMLSFSNQSTEKYRAKIVKLNNHFDIAFLEFENKEDTPKQLQHLDIANNLDLAPGFELLLAGFPQYADYHRQISLIENKVVRSNYIRSNVNSVGVSNDIEAGASGAPFLNAYCQVVGMAVKGRTISEEGNGHIIDGENIFISAKHFLEPLPD